MIPLESGNSPVASGPAPSGPALARPLVDGPKAPLDPLRLKIFLFLLFVWVMVRNGWLSEDAFITFRVVDNFIHGFGLRWNVLDRVQVYTHPLWLFCLSAFYFAHRSIYFAAMAPSFLCSGLAVWLLLSRGLQSPVKVLLGAILLVFSKAFIDFSTSGLENPLSNLLLVLFFLEYFRAEDQPEQAFRRMAWLTGLILVNRMDLIWLIWPALIQLAGHHELWRPRHLRLWAGLLVFAAWEAFSLLYYGLPFPNTAYVKLFSGVAPLHLAAQGGYYLVNSLAWDPLTLFATTALLVLGLRRWREDRALCMLCLGIVLQLAYTVRIGGDYMSGRFLSAPFLASVMVLSRLRFENPLEAAGLGATFLALGIWSPHPPIAIDDDYKGARTNFQWVDDEHGLRANDTGFLRLNKDSGLEQINNPWVHEALLVKEKGTRVMVYPNIGYFGFFAGPGLHIIDPFAIGDPLLAHLPCDKLVAADGTVGDCHVISSVRWASGHFVREIPEGYESAALGEGVLADPEMEAYWEKIALLTRGKLFDPNRLKEILRFNLGLDRPPRPR